jgi:hypothetical protein
VSEVRTLLEKTYIIYFVSYEDFDEILSYSYIVKVKTILIVRLLCFILNLMLTLFNLCYIDLFPLIKFFLLSLVCYFI